MSHADFPVCLRLSGRRVLLVGGGKIATSRCAQLLEAGAEVHVVAPSVTSEIAALATAQRVRWSARGYRPSDVQNAELVLAAVDDDAVSRAVASDARAAGIWVNAADVVDACDFTLPSVGRRGPIVVAVSTGGQAPGLAAHLRRELMERVDQGHVDLARLVGWLRLRLPKGAVRMGLLKEIVDGEAGELLRRGKRREAIRAVRGLLTGGAA